MKQINYTGSSKLISRIVSLLNRKAPLPLDGNGDPDWGTNGQVLMTDGSGSTSWGAGGGGGDSVSWTQTQLSGDKIAEIDINGTTTNVYAPSQTPQAQADWTEADNTAVDYIKNKPNLATVATSGDYSDLLNKPTIPSVGGHTIEKSDGTDMAARALLQFIGAYLQDDAGGDRTIANIVRTMTQAQFNNLSAAEKEGFIYVSDAAGQLTASEVALAAIAGMSATTVQSGIAELKSLIGSIGRTVTTLVNETANIAASGNKTYSALTATALSAYDELHFMVNYGNVFLNATVTKEEMQAITAYTNPANGRLRVNISPVYSGVTTMLEYMFYVRADANGLNVMNGSTTSKIDSVLVQGIKYN